MSLRLPVNDFKWVEETCQFNKDFIKNYSSEGYFCEVDVQYLENLHNLHNDLPFLPERMKIEKKKKKMKNLQQIFIIRRNMLST